MMGQRQNCSTLLRTGPCGVAGGAAVKKEKDMKGKVENILGV